MTRVVRGPVYVDSKMSYPKDYRPSPMIKEWKRARGGIYLCPSSIQKDRLVFRYSNELKAGD